MKKQVLIIMLLAVSFSLLAQEESTEPFKKANTITVYTDKSDSLNYYEFGRQLLKWDYLIDKKDNDFFTISTKYRQSKTHPGWNYSYMYDVHFTEGKIMVRIFWILGLDINVGMVKMNDNPNRWKWTANGGNNSTWLETLEMLNDYCECKITYSIR